MADDDDDRPAAAAAAGPPGGPPAPSHAAPRGARVVVSYYGLDRYAYACSMRGRDAYRELTVPYALPRWRHAANGAPSWKTFCARCSANQRRRHPWSPTPEEPPKARPMKRYVDVYTARSFGRPHLLRFRRLRPRVELPGYRMTAATRQRPRSGTGRRWPSWSRC